MFLVPDISLLPCYVSFETPQGECLAVFDVAHADGSLGAWLNTARLSSHHKPIIQICDTHAIYSSALALSTSKEL